LPGQVNLASKKMVAGGEEREAPSDQGERCEGEKEGPSVKESFASLFDEKEGREKRKIKTRG